MGEWIVWVYSSFTCHYVLSFFKRRKKEEKRRASVSPIIIPGKPHHHWVCSRHICQVYSDKQKTSKNTHTPITILG